MMTKWIISLLSGGPYYVRVNSQRLSIRDVVSSETFECVPRLGLDEAGKVASVGAVSTSGAVRTINPFEHARIVIDDFDAAEKLLRHAIRQISGRSWIRAAPVVVIHPDTNLAGGLSQIEIRALKELGEGAGARKALVHYGRPLTNEEVRDLAAS